MKVHEHSGGILADPGQAPGRQSGWTDPNPSKLDEIPDRIRDKLHQKGAPVFVDMRKEKQERPTQAHRVRLLRA